MGFTQAREAWVLTMADVTRHPFRRQLLVVVAALGIWLNPAGLLANDARYQDVVVGARATGLGGAFTAISDDASGLLYNPAGMADVKRANLSISTSLYGFERTSDGAIFTGLPLTGLPRLTGSDINVIPATAGSVLGLGDLLPDGAHRHAVGFGLMVPSLRSTTLEEDSTEDSPHGTGRRHVLSFFDRQLWAGAGYAYRLGESVRMGVALHYVLRTVSANDHYTVVGWDAASETAVFQNVESELELQSGSAVMVVGVKVMPFKKLSLGLSVNTQSIQLHHNGSLRVSVLNARKEQDDYRSDVISISSGPEANLSGENVGSRTPFSARLGFAWVEHADWTLAADVALYLPTYYRLVPASADALSEGVPFATRIDRQRVINGHLGYEMLISRTISLAVGGFTNLPSAPRLLVDDKNVLLADSSRLSRIPTVGLTFAGGYLSSFSLTRLGFVSTFGVGDRVGVTEGADNGQVGFRKYTSSEWTCAGARV
jgi:hypothetical protein